MAGKDVTKMSREELEAEAAALAKQRTEVRERQNEVQAQLDLTIALEAMPAEARRIVTLRLEGGSAPTGAAGNGKGA